MQFSKLYTEDFGLSNLSVITIETVTHMGWIENILQKKREGFKIQWTKGISAMNSELPHWRYNE